MAHGLETAGDGSGNNLDVLPSAQDQSHVWPPFDTRLPRATVAISRTAQSDHTTPEHAQVLYTRQKPTLLRRAVDLRACADAPTGLCGVCAGRSPCAVLTLSTVDRKRVAPGRTERGGGDAEI